MKKYLGLILLLLCLSVSIAAQAGPTFFYVVTAVDTAGFESAFSNQVTATFLLPAQKNVALTWTAPAIPTGGTAIAGYNVYRSKVSGSGYVKVNTALITSGVAFTDAFVLPNAPTLAAPAIN
jgi:hypothetical protein